MTTATSTTKSKLPHCNHPSWPAKMAEAREKLEVAIRAMYEAAEAMRASGHKMYELEAKGLDHRRVIFAELATDIENATAGRIWKYTCPECGKSCWRTEDKKWIKSWCDKTGSNVRITRSKD